MLRPLLVALILAGGLIRDAQSRHHHLHHHEHNPHAEEVIINVPPPPAAETTAVDVDIDRNTVVDAATGIVYNPYSKHHPGRHVCSNHKNVTQPVKTRQSFCKPTYKKYTQRCEDNQLCSAIRVVYETGYRDVVTTKINKQVFHYCCPGWKQATNRSYGCHTPVCSDECHNGGTCTKPEFCTCQRGFTGRTCEVDRDECKEEKPCDQICVNQPGSYRCECRENYNLQEDGHSCKLDDDQIGFEAKEMQFEELDSRIHKIENILEENNPGAIKNSFREFDDKLTYFQKDFSLLKQNIVQKAEYKEDLTAVKQKLEKLEKKSNKIDDLAARYDKMKKAVYRY